MENYTGQTLGGRYEVLEVIGTGGMAIVYKAFCTVLNRYVAIKVLKDEFASDEEFRKRFYNEAQAVAKLSHNNIVSIYDVCKDEGGAEYIVMELCEGVTLKDYLRKKKHLTWQETLYFAQQVAKALDHAHSRGIIHQDIKPQNIMLLRDGTAKVMDFGIASFANSQETKKVSSEAIGSVHYISPEQANGKPVDYRTDLYSLGVVMYEILTGVMPFRGDTAVAVVMQHLNTVPPVPSKIIPDIPQGMDEIVMHAMCANANLRYRSALDMYRDMERLRANPNVVFHYSDHSGASSDYEYGSREEENVTQLIQSVPETEQTTGGYTAAVPPQREVKETRRQAPAPKRERDYDYDDDYDDYQSSRRSKQPQKKNSGSTTKVVVGAAVVVLVVVISFLLKGMLGGSTGGDESELIAVPNLLTMNYDKDVVDNKDYDAFEFKITKHADNSGNYEDGEIIDQDPTAGTKVKAGSTITLTVITTESSSSDSNESSTITVPSDLVGKTYEDAQSAVRAAGLNAVRSEQSSDSVQAGYVISTDPAGGTKVAANSSVTIVVSSGPANTNKQVPSLTGMTQSAAKAMLESMELQLGEVKEEESDEPAGTVINQTVPAGTEVAKGTSVGITVAIAKQQTDDNNNNNGGNGSATVAVSNSAIVVTLPTDRDSCRVTVSVGGSMLYNENVKTSRGTAKCRVSYSGQRRVVVTVDGATVYDADYNFG